MSEYLGPSEVVGNSAIIPKFVERCVMKLKLTTKAAIFKIKHSSTDTLISYLHVGGWWQKILQVFIFHNYSIKFL